MRAGHPVFAAAYSRMARSLEAGPIGAERRDLLTRAGGVVVDLGAGIGLNLPHLGDAVPQIHLIEPDPHMIRRLPPDLPDRVIVHRSRAENLPLADGSVDTVLATLTLCTVDDPATACSEIRRVLRPGGQVLILEHVLALDPRSARWQQRLHRPWRWFGAGCNSNRDTGGALTAAGFDVSRLRRITVPGLSLTREWLTGRAI
jgi:ubiquinone/menaquinone biosynthesis C-methylase UbiE